MLTPESLIRDGEISVPAELWADLNKKYSRESIKNLLSKAIEKVPLPISNCSHGEALTDFYELSRMNCLPLIQTGNLSTRFPYKTKLSNTFISQCNTGLKSSGFFTFDSRMLCDSINSPSPMRSWHNEKFRMGLLNSLWSLKFTEINTKNLKTAIALRKYIASQFRPSAAKALYQHFQSRDVIDFSSGWGDRLSGFLACNDSVRSYRGFDPNSRLIADYSNLLKSLNGITNVNHKTVSMQCIPAEEADFGEETCDTVFTSPPYFIAERYSQEETQSWQRYKKLDLWLEKFLFTVIRKSWKALRPEGHLILNISDVYANHQINKICDPMNDFIRSLPDAVECEHWGLRIAKRPQSLADDREGIFTEPIWIWRKGERSMPRKKTEAPAPAPVAAPAAKKSRQKPSDFGFAIWVKGRTPSAFVNSKEEVREFIAKLPAKDQSSVTVYEKLAVKVQTTVTI